MEWLQVVVLSIVQGVTEFLPISSSGHLVLAPMVMGVADQGVAFDIALHVGTLAAVMWYFRSDVVMLLSGAVQVFQFKLSENKAKNVVNLSISTIPLIVLALLLVDFVAGGARNLSVLATTSITFGLLLYLADWSARKGIFSYLNVMGAVADVWPHWFLPKVYRRVAKSILMGARREVRTKPLENIDDIKWYHALIFGLFQALAIIPGTSRSGVCMTAGRFMNLSRKLSSHYAMLMAIPTILIAGLYSMVSHLGDAAEASFSMVHFAVGLTLSFVTAYYAIAFLMRWVEKIGFLPFVIYRVALGLVLFAVAFYQSTVLAS